MTIGPGVYLLILEARGTIEVGRLGPRQFDGWYLYVGSARGPGGLSRVRRHFAYAGRPDPPRSWHIDRLLGRKALRAALVAATDANLECALSEALGERLAVACPGFGSTGCGCESHLYEAPSEAGAIRAGGAALRAVGLNDQLARSLEELEEVLGVGG